MLGSVMLFLVPDTAQVAATNVSRALRGKALQDEPWLDKIEKGDGTKLFYLTENWKDYWELIFSIPAPDID
jgi:hypothetical protein